MGYIPTSVEGKADSYYGGDRQLFRLQSGRVRPLDTVGIMLEGPNIVEGYKQLGHKTVGTGGVRWFRNTTLTSIFETFNFRGPAEQKSVFAPRSYDEFVLLHPNDIVSAVKDQPYFLFVNCLETHVPYDTGESAHPPELQEIMYRASSIWGCKRPACEEEGITGDEIQLLHQLQIKAVEAIDERLNALCELLPGELLFVACGDHGECFGENGYYGHGMPYPAVMEVPLILGFRDATRTWHSLDQVAPIAPAT